MITIKQKHDYDCDVLIAGAGPAGSGLACHLASKGMHVIVAEAETFPRDKVCGDGVSPVALDELHQMGITGTKKFKKANEIKRVGLFIKDEKVFINLAKPDRLPFHARIIPRIELDGWICEAAKKAGAVYLESTRVIGYTTSPGSAFVKLKNRKKTFQIRARVLVGADGGSSTVARQMRGGKPSEEYQLLGLRAYYEGVNGPADRVDIYFSEESFPGIFWMFPKGSGGANIGIAMVSRTLPDKPSHVKELLQNHIRNNPDIAERIGAGKLDGKMKGWPITFYNPDSDITCNRLLLVGEAAGLINPLSGDGIQYALLSARWASETLADCFQNDDFSQAALRPYRERVNSEVGYDFALSGLLVQFPRNKTFSKAWMTILSVMISRAKKDPGYASTIAGIFEGTYPSYDALTFPFIVKSLEEGGMEAIKLLQDHMQNPSSIIETGMDAWQDLFSILNDIRKDPVVHGEWAVRTAVKTLSVAGYVAGDLTGKKKL
jgi:menaquinone-9 beta-reductase